MATEYVLAAVLMFTTPSGKLVEVESNHAMFRDPQVCMGDWNATRRAQAGHLTFIGINGNVCTPQPAGRRVAPVARAEKEDLSELRAQHKHRMRQIAMDSFVQMELTHRKMAEIYAKSGLEDKRDEQEALANEWARKGEAARDDPALADRRVDELRATAQSR